MGHHLKVYLRREEGAELSPKFHDTLPCTKQTRGVTVLVRTVPQYYIRMLHVFIMLSSMWFGIDACALPSLS